MVEIRNLRGKLEETIQQWLDEGKKVSGGYLCTTVKGFHVYYVMYKKS